MGNRYKKTLWFEGKVVAEYLGSDDPDEDVTAAHEALKAAGITERPARFVVMRGHADAFAYIADQAYRQLQRRHEGIPIVAAPFAVNAALSVELYLKALYVAEEGDPPKEHSLLELFDGLPQTVRQKLAAEASALAHEHGETSGVQFRDLLTMLDQVFVKWRYVYELEHSGSLHLQQTILALHACHAVCRGITAKP
jgi:hypothetical protein